MALKSYYAVSSYKDKKSLFGFNEGDVVQLMQKDPSGWLNVDYWVCMYVCIPSLLGMWKSPYTSVNYRLAMCLAIMASVCVCPNLVLLIIVLRALPLPGTSHVTLLARTPTNDIALGSVFMSWSSRTRKLRSEDTRCLVWFLVLKPDPKHYHLVGKVIVI